VKDQGSHDLASEYGAQRACLMAKVHWDRKGLNPPTILFYSTLFDPVSTNYDIPNTVRKNGQDMSPVLFNYEAFKLAAICDLRFTVLYIHELLYSGM
jgi:hypothetical protein